MGRPLNKRLFGVAGTGPTASGTEIKVNFVVIANVPLYKNINQKDYSIVKLKKEEI